MAYTSLEEVWVADILGTDDRVQSDGVWTPTFASAIETPPTYIVATPGFESSASDAGIPNTRQVHEELRSPFGEGIDPDYTPGEWVDLRDAWTTLDESELIADRGYWQMSNLGVASPLPVRWFGLTGDAVYDDPDIPASGSVSKIIRRFAGAVQLGSTVFEGRTEADLELFIFIYSGSVANINQKGIIFAHLDNEDVLTLGIVGESYFDSQLIHDWDFFHGVPLWFYLSDSFSTPLDERFRVDLTEDPSYIFGDTPETSSGFQVLPVEADIKLQRFFNRRGVGVYWQGTLQPTGTDEEGEEVFQSIRNSLRNNTTMALEVEWAVVGGVGRDVYPT